MKLNLPLALENAIRELTQAGFRAVVVGGAVRDALLNIPVKDFDVEVYGITYHQLATRLASHGRVDLVGQSFGVVKLTVNGATFDLSVPRRDSKTGLGHRDFLATFDPSITPQEAASRRDFTINAMAYDPVANQLLDFFGGETDLREKILRATSSAFSEDPLRVLRGMQFACRFDLTMDQETAAMSRAIAGQYVTLAKERIAEEFMKWALKSVRPGRIAQYLRETGWLIHFPEIAGLFGTPQDPQWHPEGDVGVHTMYVLNEAAWIAERDGLNGDDRAVLLFSALAHDFAKPATTQLRARDGGPNRWTSWGHEAAGGPIARAFLERIGIKASIVDPIVKLVENHLAHHHISPHLTHQSTEHPSTNSQDEHAITARTVRRLALRLAPANIEQLARLIEADASGRPPLEKGLPPSAAKLLAAAQAQSVHAQPQPPLILGRHVMPYFDDRPGEHIGRITRAAYEAQTDGAFSTNEEAMRWLAAYVERVI